MGFYLSNPNVSRDTPEQIVYGRQSFLWTTVRCREAFSGHDWFHPKLYSCCRWEPKFASEGGRGFRLRIFGVAVSAAWFTVMQGKHLVRRLAQWTSTCTGRILKYCIRYLSGIDRDYCKTALPSGTGWAQSHWCACFTISLSKKRHLHTFNTIESSAHSNWGFLALILQDQIGGLQYQSNGSGGWLDVPSDDEDFAVVVINCGDCLT